MKIGPGDVTWAVKTEGRGPSPLPLLQPVGYPWAVAPQQSRLRFADVSMIREIKFIVNRP